MTDIDVNKLEVIDKCILLFIKYNKHYSNFLGQTLEANYNSFKDNVNTGRKNRYINNIENNLDSITKIEDKKYNEDLYNNVIEDSKSYIKKSYKDGLIDSTYSRYLDSLIKGISKDIIISFIKEYESLCYIKKEVKKVKPKKKTSVIILPKETDKKEIKIEYLKVNDLIYMHMKAMNEFPFMEFDNDSFMLEVKQYNDSVNSNKLTIFNDLNKYELSKLAPFEKKRRNYVRNMFKTESKIKSLKYDTEEYFKTCLDIVNNLYVELNDFDDNNSSLDKLLKMTKLSYGGKRQLESYKEIIKNVDINCLINCNFVDRYTAFSDINAPVPNYDDIIRLLNKRIIDKISFNIDDYINNIDKVFDNVCEYMVENDIIEFYKEFKNVLNTISLKKNMNNIIIKLQENVSKKLCGILNISEDEVISEYLKEEKMY